MKEVYILIVTKPELTDYDKGMNVSLETEVFSFETLKSACDYAENNYDVVFKYTDLLGARMIMQY